MPPLGHCVATATRHTCARPSAFNASIGPLCRRSEPGTPVPAPLLSMPPLGHCVAAASKARPPSACAWFRGHCQPRVPLRSKTSHLQSPPLTTDRHKHTHACLQIMTQVCTHRHTHTYTHTIMPACTLWQVCTHTHTCLPAHDGPSLHALARTCLRPPELHPSHLLRPALPRPSLHTPTLGWRRRSTTTGYTACTRSGPMSFVATTRAVHTASVCEEAGSGTCAGASSSLCGGASGSRGQ